MNVHGACRSFAVGEALSGARVAAALGGFPPLAGVGELATRGRDVAEDQLHCAPRLRRRQVGAGEVLPVLHQDADGALRELTD